MNCTGPIHVFVVCGLFFRLIHMSVYNLSPIQQIIAFDVYTFIHWYVFKVFYIKPCVSLLHLIVVFWFICCFFLIWLTSCCQQDKKKSDGGIEKYFIMVLNLWNKCLLKSYGSLLVYMINLSTQRHYVVYKIISIK